MVETTAKDLGRQGYHHLPHEHKLPEEVREWVHIVFASKVSTAQYIFNVVRGAISDISGRAL